VSDDDATMAYLLELVGLVDRMLAAGIPGERVAGTLDALSDRVRDPRASKRLKARS
jgi:hypothetical protein